MTIHAAITRAARIGQALRGDHMRQRAFVGDTFQAWAGRPALDRPTILRRAEAEQRDRDITTVRELLGRLVGEEEARRLGEEIEAAAERKAGQ